MAKTLSDEEYLKVVDAKLDEKLGTCLLKKKRDADLKRKFC